MKKYKLLSKAKNLRKKGYSLREISEKLVISKSTASLWVSGLAISAEGKKRLNNIKKEAIIKSIKIKKRQKESYLKSISKKCSVFKDGRKYSKNDYKIFLALLFWGEGTKKDRRLVFMNSDPEMIKVYLFLLRKSFDIKNEKLRAILHLHNYHDTKKQIKYWSQVTKINKDHISVYNKENTGKRKKEDYKGCISIRYGNVKILDELLLIIERFKKYIVAGVG